VDRFLIAPFSTGLETYLKPWLIPDDAFAKLQNAYVFRGRVRKRFGGQLMGLGTYGSITAPLSSRLRVNLGTTDGAGNIAGVIPGTVIVGRIGLAFSIGTEIFTVYQTGAPAVMLTTGSSTVHTYNTTNGAYVITGAAPATALYYYPGLPVMGLTVYEDYGGAFNNDPSYAFDTQFAYVFTGVAWERSGTAVWHGSNINLFWSTNWRGATPDIKVLFTTNFNFTLGAPGANDDPIWWTVDGTNWTSGTGVNAFYFMPMYGGPPPVPQAPFTGAYVKTARIIVVFQERLLLLNTVENNNPNHDGSAGTNTQYRNRARYSHIGSPFAQNAWYEANQRDNAATDNSIADGGGFLDAPTDEEIISAAFIKNRLIVYFDFSTWELVYLNNPLDPFRWQRLSDSLGSQSTFSSISFDKNILTMGTTGVHSCNGSNVERIDEKIPDTVFTIRQQNLGDQRVWGIRDFFTELVYWSYPSIGFKVTNVYPNQVLVYNYRNDTWAMNDDCITAFGYLEQSPSRTWATSDVTWEQALFNWQSGEEQANFREIIAGNQEGFVFIVDADIGRNAPVMQLTNVSTNSGFIQLTIMSHNLEAGDYIALENVTGVTFTSPINDGIFQVFSTPTIDTVFIVGTFTGTYLGGGTVTRISNIEIQSKQWNPYVSKDRNVYLSKIDFCVTTTALGQITADYFASYTDRSLVKDGQDTGTLLGTNVLETFPYPSSVLEFNQSRLWHPIYFQSDGEAIELSLYFKDDPDLALSQIRQRDIVWSDFQLEGMVLYTMPTTDRLQ